MTATEEVRRALVALADADDAYTAAGERADAAFRRWLHKVERDQRTSAAAATRLQNLASYASADYAAALNRAWRYYPDVSDEDALRQIAHAEREMAR